MHRRFVYYAMVCILITIILSDTLSWFIWQYSAPDQINMDLSGRLSEPEWRRRSSMFASPSDLPLLGHQDDESIG